MAGVTGQQRMLTPPRHLILPLVTPEVCVSLIISCTWYGHWFLLRIVPFYLTGIADFDCVLIRSPNLDTLILTTDIWIWNGAHGGCDRSAEDAYSFATPDPTFAFVGGPFCLTLDFVIAFWTMVTFYALLTSLFCTVTAPRGSGLE
jgi:hypothetical protein